MTTTNENPAALLESEIRELQAMILSDRDTLAALATDIDEFRNGHKSQPPTHRKGERLVSLAVEIAMNERALSILLGS